MRASVTVADSILTVGLCLNIIYRLLLKISFAVLSATILPAFAGAEYTATVDLNTRYQTFEGWGTSLAWWANVVGGYPDVNRSDYITQFFDPVSGLGLNIVRYNIGGGENPSYLPPNYAYIQYRARVPGFEPTSGNYDWTQDANQRWILQQSIQKGATIQEAFSNSPPYWMTNSMSATGAVDSGDNLNPAYTSNFADYLTTVVKYYHDIWGSRSELSRGLTNRLQDTGRLVVIKRDVILLPPPKTR